MANPPSPATVVIPNHDGAHHLRPCLESLAKLEYPAGHVEVLVVDNGSSDGSQELARSLGATVLELTDNLGFAAACNAGARAATNPLVAFLNNDMVVDPRWLVELVAQLDSPTIRCVGGAILDWAGERIDFAGGSINFHGFGDQPGHGLPASELTTEPRTREPFACGGSMLIDRDLFLEVGGFDEDYFAYFEDVDLGWRLNVLGHAVAFAPASRCMHRHHGTSSRFAPHQRTLLLERNALISLIKNVDDANLGRLLGPAALLLVARALDTSRSERGRYRPFARTRGSERVPAASIARLHAASDVLEHLPRHLAARERIQALRRRDDADVFSRFGAWSEPIGATSDAYRDAFRNVVALVQGPHENVSNEPRELGGTRGWASDTAARWPILRRIAGRKR